MKKIRDSKIFKIIKKTINALIVIILLGFVLVVFLQRFSDNKISILNYRMFSVITGSMKPKYDIGDVLVSKEVDYSSIKVGDVISYEGKVGDFNGKVITHEVKRIEKDENGHYLFHAQGLANLVEDPVISEDQVYGVVVYKIFLLSFLYKIINTKIGFFLIIVIPLIFIVGSEIISTLLEKEEKKRNKTI